MTSPLEYRDQANEAVRMACGLSYDELTSESPKVDQDNAMLMAAQRSGLTPGEFAWNFCEKNRFVRVAEVGEHDAIEYNTRRAAIIEFVASSRWSLDATGAAVMKTGSGDMVLDVCQRDGQYGFVARVDNVAQCTRLDIGNAIVGLVQRMRLTAANGPRIPSVVATNIEPQEQARFSM